MELIEKGRLIEHVSGSLDKIWYLPYGKGISINKVSKIKHFVCRI